MSAHKLDELMEKGPAATVVVSQEYQGDSDAAHLARLGKKPVLKRDFGFLSMLGFSCTVMVSWEALLVLFSINFLNGGSAGSFIGYWLVWAGTLCAFATMAELASMAPTAAGQYHWVAMLAPEGSKKFLSYVIGWLTVTGWYAQFASTCFLVGLLLQGLAQLTHPDTFQPAQWQPPLIYWAVVAFSMIFNTVAVRYLPQVEGVVLILHVLGFFAIIIPLLVFAPRGDPAVIFTTWLNEGNWPTQGLSFMVGLIGPAFGLLGGDAAVHMSEEIKNPAINVPRAIVTCIALNGALALAMLVAVLFCMGDPEVILQSPLPFPFMAIFQQAVSSTAGCAVMVIVIIVLGLCAAISTAATASRLTWAFARDRGLPGWRIWAKVETKTNIPLASVGLTCAVVVILACIGFGSVVAFNALVSLTINGLYSSYLIGNTLLLMRRLGGRIDPYSLHDNEMTNTMGTSKLSWGPWKIPEPFGTIINILGCLYLLIMLFFSFWPTGIDPTNETMNWSVLMVGAISIISLLYYFVYGKKSYKGPAVETEAI